MAQQPIIEFTWKYDPKGYHFVESRGPMRIVRAGSNGAEKLCRPLNGEEFRIFASQAHTPQGALDFVHRYGPLTWEGWDEAKGDLVLLIQVNAVAMRALLDATQNGRSKPGVEAPDITVHATVIWDQAAKAPRWCFRPNTLLDALWLQFGQEVTRGVKMQTCQHCGAWFQAGAGTGRRADAKFCSDEHRVTFNSLKRSMGD
jgi:hypothetical protein